MIHNTNYFMFIYLLLILLYPINITLLCSICYDPLVKPKAELFRNKGYLVFFNLSKQNVIIFERFISIKYQ